MAQITNLKLFFTRFGGIDMPVSYSWFSKFGFNAVYDAEKQIYTEYGSPIYKHSLMDVLNNFDEPKNFITKDQMNQNKSVSDLMIVETHENEAANNIAINSTFWNYVLKLLEMINQNQTEWKEASSQTSTDGNAFSCYGDQLLRSGDPTYADLAKIYKAGSLSVVTSTNFELKDRILSCTFTVIHTTAQGLTLSELSEDGVQSDGSTNTVGNAVTINAYFNPDTYIAVGATTNYKVYSYEDLTGNNEVDDTEVNHIGEDGAARSEFDSSIVYKLTDILKSGKFKRYIRFCPEGGTDGSTFYIDQGTYSKSTSLITTDDGTEINASNMRDYGYNKPFYIFTSLDETQPITDATLLKYVREYVTDKMYPGDGNTVEKMTRFPNMFTESVVSIYPMITNKNNNGNIKSPIDGDTISKFMNIIGLTGTQYEIFFVGRSTYGGGINKYISIPLFATENDVNNNSAKPISSRFPTYRPIYSSADDNDDVQDVAIIFHDLCILAMSILIGGVSINSVITNDGIAGDYQNIIINGEENSFVTSSMNLTETSAGTDPTTGMLYNHTVSFTYNNVKYQFIEVVA